MAVTEVCPGCGEVLPAVDGPAHPYIGASPACWARYADWQVTPLRPGAAHPLRRLVVDAYAVQHHGVPERRAIQSVGLHLVALRLVLVGGLDPEGLSRILQGILARPPAWRWLEPPGANGAVTIGAIVTAPDGPGEAAAIDGYVRGIWSAWQEHRAAIDAWSLAAGYA